MFCALKGATDSPRRLSHAQMAVVIQLLPAFEDVPPTNRRPQPSSSRASAPDDPNQIWTADARRDGAGRNLGGASSTRPRASHDASRTPPSRKAHGISNRSSPPRRPRKSAAHEPDETDRSGQRHRRRRQDRACNVALEERSFHLRPARRRPGFADGEQIPLAALADDDQAGSDDHQHVDHKR